MAESMKQGDAVLNAVVEWLQHKPSKAEIEALVRKSPLHEFATHATLVASLARLAIDSGDRDKLRELLPMFREQLTALSVVLDEIEDECTAD